MVDTNKKNKFLDYVGLSLFWSNVKKVIEDNELVTTTALTNLDTRVDTVEDFLSNQIISISYTDLKTLRDNAQLVPGQQYRITDYQCTTTQESTKSAGHQFDIIVTADSESILNEEARAIQHDGDTYFDNSNLSAWKIWYCLDNDTSRFAWADATNGKGVIYRMIDEWNNDIPYDFKNIQFKHPNDPTTYPHYYYTFASSNAEDNTDLSLDILNNCYSNIIRKYVSSYKRKLNSIIFIGSFCFNNTFGSDCYSNTFSSFCHSNTFGSYCTNNSFGSDCYYNTFGSYCSSNSFGSNCSSNIFGSNCDSNTFGSGCSSNTFDPDCYDNSFGSYCTNNSFGSSCFSNTFGSSCYNNTFGSNCASNSFGEYCSNNSFGSYCRYIKFSSDSSATTKYNYYQYNHFGDGCNDILFKGVETASSSAQIQNYNFSQGTSGTYSAYLTIDGVRNRNFETKVEIDSNGNLKIFCLADLIIFEEDTPEPPQPYATNIIGDI